MYFLLNAKSKIQILHLDWTGDPAVIFNSLLAPTKIELRSLQITLGQPHLAVTKASVVKSDTSSSKLL